MGQGESVHPGGSQAVIITGGRCSIVYQRNGNWITEFYHDEALKTIKAYQERTKSEFSKKRTYSNMP